MVVKWTPMIPFHILEILKSSREAGIILHSCAQFTCKPTCGTSYLLLFYRLTIVFISFGQKLASSGNVDNFWSSYVQDGRTPPLIYKVSSSIFFSI